MGVCVGDEDSPGGSLPVVTEESTMPIQRRDVADHEMEDGRGETSSVIACRWRKILGSDFAIVVADLVKGKSVSGLGISLEGTVDVEGGKDVRPHHYIRSILPDGPVGLSAQFQAGDELLEVNQQRLLGVTHNECVVILKELPHNIRMVCARRKRGIIRSRRSLPLLKVLY